MTTVTAASERGTYLPRKTDRALGEGHEGRDCHCFTTDTGHLPANRTFVPRFGVQVLIARAFDLILVVGRLRLGPPLRAIHAGNMHARITRRECLGRVGDANQIYGVRNLRVSGETLPITKGAGDLRANTAQVALGSVQLGGEDVLCTC